MDTYRSTIEESYRRLQQIDEETASRKPSPAKWSKKEILGHLCDSCINNYYRFMHLQSSAEPFVVVKYTQDEWVATRNYQGDAWKNILTEWYALHQSLLSILDNSLPQNAKKPVIVDGVSSDYQFLADDYFVHLKHHINQIL